MLTVIPELTIGESVWRVLLQQLGQKIPQVVRSALRDSAEKESYGSAKQGPAETGVLIKDCYLRTTICLNLKKRCYI